MAKYPFETIEPKWQCYWEENKTFRVTEDPAVPEDKRAYVLDMFPYPSAQGLHVGHPEGYTATDIYCRYLRMNDRHASEHYNQCQYRAFYAANQSLRFFVRLGALRFNLQPRLLQMDAVDFFAAV